MTHRPKHIAEYVLFRGLAGFLRILPHRAALCAGCGLAGFMHFVLRFRKKQAMERLKEVLGDRYTPQEMKRIAWISFRNMVFNCVEGLRMDRYEDTSFDTWIDLQEVLETIREHNAQDRGVIAVLAHTGNWDLGTRIVGLNGIPAVYIARSQSNLLTYGYFHRIRSKAGIRVEDRDDPSLVRKVIRHLNAGRMLGVMVDLRAKHPSPGLVFLGKEAHIAGGIGLIARKSNAIVLPITMLREGWFKHRWILNEPVQSNPKLSGKEDRKHITQHCLDQLSPSILEHPEQYFWYNKRWVLQPFPTKKDAE
jgi:KDO2-lipid IV(A) lauroyltransferase